MQLNVEKHSETISFPTQQKHFAQKNGGMVPSTTQNVSANSALSKDEHRYRMIRLSQQANQLIQVPSCPYPMTEVFWVMIVYSVKGNGRGNVRECLHQCLTKDGSKAILTAARKKGDARISGLGEDLIAKEAKYHNSCRLDYVRQSVAVESSNRKKHDEAFQKLSHFVDNEIFKKKTPILAATLLSVYTDEYIAFGGAHEDINSYTIQSLMSPS